VVDLSGEPGPLSAALRGRASPVLVAAAEKPGAAEGAPVLDPARLVARLRPIVLHAREAASALARMRSLSDPRSEARPPVATELGLRPACARTDELARTVAALALDSKPVVIHGPAGSGKKHIARLLHALSPRHGGPFVVLDAQSATPDAVAAAHGGTIVLEGAERLPPSLVPVLAGIADERRIGERTVDARLVLVAREDPLAPFAGSAPRALIEASHVLRLPALGERPEEAIALTD